MKQIGIGCSLLAILGLVLPLAAWPADTVSTLQECIRIALEKNRQQQISQLAVETAEAQLKQAFSSYWPQVSFESGYNHFDENINFIFPQETSQYVISGLAPVPLSTTVTVPAKDVTVMERDNLFSRLQVMMPLFTGGTRKATVRQARAGVSAAQQARRRTQLQLIHDVRCMYHAAILARRVAAIGSDALKRLEATVELSEALYQGGSQSVTRRDYLRSKMVLESARSIVTALQTNIALTESALGNTMGMAWNEAVRPADSRIPFVTVDTDLGQMVASAYRFNPDWQQLASAIEAYDAKVDEQKAKRWPMVGLSGTLWRWDHNMNDSGLGTADNEKGWTVGVGLEVPLFSGFLTTNKIKAARLEFEAMQARQMLFKEGLALQLKHAFLQMDQAGHVQGSAKAAAQYATEHRDLTERAYRQDMVKTDDLLEAQIIEALTLANAQKALYSHAASRFLVDFLVGREISRLFE